MYPNGYLFKLLSKIFLARCRFPFSSQRTFKLLHQYRHRSHGKVSSSSSAKIFFEKRPENSNHCVFRPLERFPAENGCRKALCYRHHPSRSLGSRNYVYCKALTIFDMRAIWKGSISFSLINIPVALYPATRREELKFRLLRRSDLSPVNYKRVAAVDGKEVPWEQIVKGYEYEKGKFVVLKDEDFKRVDLEATDTIDIVDFVDLAQINPVYFHRPYYLEPQKGGAGAYKLLRQVLADTGRAGIS